MDAHTAEVVNEVLGRWDALDPDVRVRLARMLLMKLEGDDAVAALDGVALRARLEQLARGGVVP
jgi:hypothetical protein